MEDIGMEHNYLLSIIVTVYNMEKYINQCIDSILNQTYDNIEIIIIDDGSTDSSPQICDGYANNNPLFKVIHQKNAGVVSARSRGIREASGEYIGFVDGDDWIESNMYSEMMEALLESNADFIDTGYIEEYGISAQRRVAGGVSRTIILSEKHKKQMVEHILRPEDAEDKIYPSHWSKIYKKSLLSSTYDKVDSSAFLGEDLVNLLLCIYEAKSVCLLRRAYYHYRNREGSLVHYVDIDKLFKIGNLFQCIKKIVANHEDDSNIQKIVDEFYVSALLDCLDGLSTGGSKICRYFYEDIESIVGKRVVLYGAGAVGQSYFNQFICNSVITLTSWVDRNYLKLNNQCLIKSPEIIRDIDFDVIVVAMLDFKMAQTVMEHLVKMGVPNEKIIWKKPKLRFLGEGM